MRNIHILPTSQVSTLSINCKTNSLQLGLENRMFHDDANVYINSNEELKEESLFKKIYVIDIQTRNIGKLTCKNNFFKGSSKLIEVKWKNDQNIWNYNHIREILLTTDQDLVKDGVQAIDDEFLEWFVNNPSCERVVVNNLFYGALGGFADAGYKIIIPKEEHKQDCFSLPDCTCKKPDFDVMKGLCKVCGNSIIHLGKRIEVSKQETLEEAFEESWLKSPFGKYSEPKIVGKKLFENGAKWQAEKMYSEEEVGDLIYKVFGTVARLKGIILNGNHIDTAYKQFKKK